ncbi:MAG: hypothetical protein GF332_03265 [Candidatus Moranbacteria bacterium]|nr:hypothetical protein [Candidatus Moranbacteria bacterium]
MHCSNCGKDLGVNPSRFCPGCGHKQTMTQSGFLPVLFNFIKKHFFKLAFLLINIIAVLVFFVWLGRLIAGSMDGSFNPQHIQDPDRDQTGKISVDWEVYDPIMPISYVEDNRKMVKLKIDSQDYIKIRTKAQAQGITEVEERVFTVKPQSKIYYLGPKIHPKGFESLDKPLSTNLVVSVTLIPEDPDRPEQEIISGRAQVNFLSKNEIIWQQGGNSNVKYIARLINKDKPEINDLVAKASSYIKGLGGETNSMLGPLGDEAEKTRQLKAIFLALAKDYNINYVYAPFSYHSLKLQQLKPPEEVLRSKSGLCIELALVYAAALENVGLNPIIVVTSNHAWVGLETEPLSQEYVFIETTALEETPEQAIRIGRENWREAKKIGDYELINIGDLRVEGLTPIK